MKLLNLFFVFLVLLWGTSVFADPPPWDEFPMPCAAEHGTCFVPFDEGWIDFAFADLGSGELIVGTIFGDFNDFFRENPDGRQFLLLIDKETDALYCPDGVVGPSCLPVSGRVSGSGFLEVGPLEGCPDCFVYQPTCPFSASVSLWGDSLRIKASLVTVKSKNPPWFPVEGCKPVRVEINTFPIN
jgi:hypothetical protein